MRLLTALFKQVPVPPHLWPRSALYMYISRWRKPLPSVAGNVALLASAAEWPPSSTSSGVTPRGPPFASQPSSLCQAYHLPSQRLGTTSRLYRDHCCFPNRYPPLPATWQLCPLSRTPPHKWEVKVCEAALSLRPTPETTCSPGSFSSCFVAPGQAKGHLQCGSCIGHVILSSVMHSLSKADQSGKTLWLQVGNGKMFSGSQQWQRQTGKEI